MSKSGFSKGDVLKITVGPHKERAGSHHVSGYRPMTHAEVAAWYKAAESWGPHDSAGDSWVCDRVMRVDLTSGETVVVSRARCAATTGWGRPASGFTEVVRSTGEVVKVRRDQLEKLV